MTHFIEKIFPLPPNDKRKLFPLLWGKKLATVCMVERDSDYLFYQAGAIIEKVSFLALILTWIDLHFGTELLLDQARLDVDKSAIIAAWGKLTGPAAIIIGWGAYLRIRMNMNLEIEPVPLFISQSEMKKHHGRRNWCQITALPVVVFLIFLPILALNFRVTEDGILSKMHLHENIINALILQIIFALCIGVATSVSLSCALVWEKSYRFYEKAREDIEDR